jgi:hypothetical protein
VCTNQKGWNGRWDAQGAGVDCKTELDGAVFRITLYIITLKQKNFIIFALVLVTIIIVLVVCMKVFALSVGLCVAKAVLNSNVVSETTGKAMVADLSADSARCGLLHPAVLFCVGWIAAPLAYDNTIGYLGNMVVLKGLLDVLVELLFLILACLTSFRWFAAFLVEIALLAFCKDKSSTTISAL